MARNKILYAEGNDWLRQAVTEFLKIFEKYDIESFSDGTLLKSRLEKDVSNVSLVIIDNQMPCCEGSRIINSYARREGFVGVPFVLLYGGSEEIGEQAVKDGAFGYVLKSGINMVDDLIETTRKALNQ